MEKVIDEQLEGVARKKEEENPSLSISKAPVVFRPFTDATQATIEKHVAEVRRCFDWPGIPYHDHEFRRWMWHDLPLLKTLHYEPEMLAELRRKSPSTSPLKPSYCFLSMYGADGVCPQHTDRPQCAMTLDYMVRSDAKEKPWPIVIDGHPITLEPGEAVLYSGTQSPHHRQPLNVSSDATYADLIFFHFVPTSFQGPLG